MMLSECVTQDEIVGGDPDFYQVTIKPAVQRVFYRCGISRVVVGVGLCGNFKPLSHMHPNF